MFLVQGKPMARKFSNFIEAFLEYTKDVEAPKAYLHWSALSIVSAALERRVWWKLGKHTFYSNLYIFLVGDPSLRKSASSGYAIGLLREVPGIGIIEGKMNEATFIQHLAMLGYKKTFNWEGRSYKTAAAYLYASEGDDAFREMYQGGGIIPVLTALYDGHVMGWYEDQPWTKVTRKEGSEMLFNPLISFLACTTPAALPQLITRQNAEGGFGSRTLLVVHKGDFKKSYKWVEETYEDVDMRLKLIADLTAISKLQGVWKVSDGFKKLWPELERKHDEQMSIMKVNSLVAGMLARKMTHAGKLCQVIAAAKRDTMHLLAEDLQEAWDLISGLEANMLAAYGTLGLSEEIRNKNELWEYLQKTKRGHFTRKEIITLFAQKLDSKQIDVAIRELESHGLIEYLPFESGQGNHRYRVNQEKSF
jgi:hypothetical protein